MDNNNTDKQKEIELKNYFKKLAKVSRCREFSKIGGVPSSYFENTPKEELVLEHVIQYRKEFSLTYDEKRELFLYPPNEFDKYKFICTTIRPTKVPYPELYDFEKCAKFLSNFLEYEELYPPNEFPRVIPSPANVLKYQIGDCFDFSIVLCSLLIGAGYNAFVVYGRAPREITTKDESNMDAPEQADDIKIIEPDLNEQNEDTNADLIREKPTIESTYVNKEYDIKEKKRSEEYKKMNEIDDDQSELERYDPWEKKRLHSWVLVKKNKRIDKDYFVECSTGRICEPGNGSPYESIDAVFNNYNFWINLQEKKHAKEIDLNLSNKDFWEYCMVSYKDNNEDVLEEEIDPENKDNPKHDQSEHEDQMLEEVLDMPPPWPEKLWISREDYNNRTPNGTQTNYYKKTKIDRYAPYSQVDGLVMRLYRYEDFARLKLEEVEYRYRYRSDKLYKRIKNPYQHKTIEYYLPGQKYGWKQVEEVEGSHKIIHYYETNYENGLIYREEIFGKKIIHRYKARDDKVVERKAGIELLGDKQSNSRDFLVCNPNYKNVLIKKFSQKYDINPLLPPEEQIFKLVYLMDPSGTKIFITYHFAKGKIIAKTKEFTEEENETQIPNEEKEDLFDKFNSEDDKLKKKLLRDKKECLENFKKIEELYCDDVVKSCVYYKAISEIKQKNKPDDLFSGSILEKNLFDKALTSGKYSQENDTQALSGEKIQSDRIRYYRELFKKKMENDKTTDLLNIKNEIIEIFKEEKLETTKILQEQLKSQVAVLNSKMDEFKNKDKTDEQDINVHNEAISDIQRKIHIIYERSHKHVTNIMAEFGKLLAELENQKF